MKYKEPKVVKVSIDSLIVNPDNARYIEPGQARNEVEAISKLIEIEGDSMIELAKSIAVHGFHHSENLLVSETEIPNQYLVLEGNRRVSTIKLMSKYRNKLDQFSIDDGYKAALNRLNTNVNEVPVAIYPIGDERPHVIIKQLHESNSKSGRHRWDPIAQERNMERNNEYTNSLAILDMILKSNHVEEWVKEKLRSTGRWYSKLQHVASMKLFKENFGITINTNCNVVIEFDEVETINAITQMLLHMSERGESAFAGNDYFSAPKRFLLYLKTVFPENLLPNRKLISTKPTVFIAAKKVFEVLPERNIQDCPYYDAKHFETTKSENLAIGTNEQEQLTSESKPLDNNKDTFDKDNLLPLQSENPTTEESTASTDKRDPSTTQPERRPTNKRDNLISTNDFFIPVKHKKAHQLFTSLSMVHLRHIDLVAIGLRSLIEYTINTYLLEVKRDTKTPYNIKIDFVEKLQKVVAHITSLGIEEYGESELRKRIPRIYEIINSNAKVDYLGIPALHLFVHSHDYCAEREQVEKIYASFKEFLKISWQIIASKN